MSLSADMRSGANGLAEAEDVWTSGRKERATMRTEALLCTYIKSGGGGVEDEIAARSSKAPFSVYRQPQG